MHPTAQEVFQPQREIAYFLVAREVIYINDDNLRSHRTGTRTAVGGQNGVEAEQTQAEFFSNGGSGALACI